MIKILAQINTQPTNVKELFGQITPPPGTPQEIVKGPTAALVKIMNVGLTAIMIVAALYTLLNLVLAGYMYVISAGDAKKVAEANQRITYTIIGLIIIALAPLVAAVIGIIVFGRWDAILNPEFQAID